MPHGTDHSSTQTLLLASRLLDTHPSLSPFTLILDSLEQPARPLIHEILSRSTRHNPRVIFVSFETLRAPAGVSSVVHAAKLPSPEAALREAAQQAHRQSSPRTGSKGNDDTRTLIVIDSLHALLSTARDAAPASLLPLVIPGRCSLVAVYHVDVPLAPAPPNAATNAYVPAPARMLSFLATSVLTVHALPHVLAAEAARRRSLPGPMFGLREGKEGVLCGLKRRRNGAAEALVVEMDHRRKSGRSVGALLVLRVGRKGARRGLCLLDEDPEWRELVAEESSDRNTADEEGLSFSLGLTDKQRRDRDEVVLPYFDAQRGDGGPGEGGRILYDMGSEDDFDEEEDEI